LILRHAERPDFSGLATPDQDSIGLTFGGTRAAMRLGRRLDCVGRIVTSPIGRCRQTARALACGAGHPDESIVVDHRLDLVRSPDLAAYNDLVAVEGWHRITQRWLDDRLLPGVLPGWRSVATRVCDTVREHSPSDDAPGTIVITHDVCVLALLASFGVSSGTAVRFLEGAWCPGRSSGGPKD
jgi:broad specificity phosphatase PhoE